FTPPSFDGATEPLEVKKWLAKMEKIFIALGSTDSENVTYATYVLQGGVYD
ncbi:hypothetical protein PanWU01x14_232390, partial [Parasponia andersonii]